jgi:hypothetical protein
MAEETRERRKGEESGRERKRESDRKRCNAKIAFARDRKSKDSQKKKGVQQETGEENGRQRKQDVNKWNMRKARG